VISVADPSGWVSVNRSLRSVLSWWQFLHQAWQLRALVVPAG
jgi:hypothetical protein